jgi:hypothetical protein
MGFSLSKGLQPLKELGAAEKMLIINESLSNEKGLQKQYFLKNRFNLKHYLFSQRGGLL